MQERTEFGSTVERELSPFSISGFESQLGNEWSYLTSADKRANHCVHINKEQLKLISYCEGDVVIKSAPDMDAFIKEQMLEISFALNS